MQVTFRGLQLKLYVYNIKMITLILSLSIKNILQTLRLLYEVINDLIT